MKQAEDDDENLVSLEEGYLSSGRFEAEAQVFAGREGSVLVFCGMLAEEEEGWSCARCFCHLSNGWWCHGPGHQ